MKGRENSYPTKHFWNFIFLAMEEYESEVLQVECGMKCSLLGEQEQRHSAGAHIRLIIIMVDAIYNES